MNYKKTTLKNGLRIITVPTKGNPAVTVMVMIEAGSNYETQEQNGLSHFLEHMCFKGTKNRPTPMDISLEFDRIGAANNAFTGEEFTGYYAKAGKKHWKKLLEVIGDMYINPTLPEAELEKERGVILQEISMYEDLPQQQVQKVFSKLLYGDTPAGRTILGPTENIKRFSRQDFVSYRAKHYLPERTIVIVAGDIDRNILHSEIKNIFQVLPKSNPVIKKKVSFSQTKPALLAHKKETDQTHLVLGFHAYEAKDKRTPALSVLAGVLSAGMSSRLFKKMRDEMGACYYIRANANPSSNYGNFTIATGINQARLEEVIKVLLNQCKRLTAELVPADELTKVKEILISHLLMGLETTDALAEFYAAEEILVGKAKTPAEIEKEIRAVTAKDIQQVAKDIFKNKNLNLAIVGNIDNTKKIQKLLTF